MQNNTLQNGNYLDQRNTNITHQRKDCLFGNQSWQYPNTPSLYNNAINAPNSRGPTTNGKVYGINNSYQPKPCFNRTPNKASHRAKKPKRVRTAFTTAQIMEFEQEYARSKYLNRNRRIELAESMKLCEKTIKVWFQNKRMKEKKDMAEDLEESGSTSTTDSFPDINVPQYTNPQHALPEVFNQYNQCSCDRLAPQKTFNQGNMHMGNMHMGNMHMGNQSVTIPTIDLRDVPLPVENAHNYPAHNLMYNAAETSLNAIPSFPNITLTEAYDDFTSVLNDRNEEIEDIVKFSELNSSPTGNTNADGSSIGGESFDPSTYSLIQLLNEL